MTGRVMTRDLVAGTLTGLGVLAFFATREGWDVWLIGTSHRWTAGLVLVLGVFACAMGSAAEEMSGKMREMGPFVGLLALLGALALGLGAVALVTGSLTWLSILVADTVVLWALSVSRHALVPASPHPA